MNYYIELNTKLVEAFGHLEQLCNQQYQALHGVTHYIDDMKEKEWNGMLRVPNWNKDFERLKNVRHKRAQLSHGEVPFAGPCAKEQDIAFVINFKNRILRQTDPLALYNQTKNRRVDSVPCAPEKRLSNYSGPQHGKKSTDKATFIVWIAIAAAAVFAVSMIALCVLLYCQSRCPR